MPKQTSGMCTANESACISRACSRYSWLIPAGAAPANRTSSLTF